MISASSNNILTVILKDGRTTSLSFPSGKNKDQCLEQAMIFENFSKEDVLKYYFSVNSEKNLRAFENFDAEKEEIDLIAQSIEFKMEEIRRHRGGLFSKLDFEFMKSLEEECKECKDHLVLIKNYLRDLPNLAELELKTYDDIEDIITFNPFNNIFKLILAEPGEGYEKPPSILIDSPNGKSKGFQLKAVAGIKDGKISELIITQYGSGYINVPKIEVSAPENPDGQRAYIVAFLPENDIYTE